MALDFITQPDEAATLLFRDITANPSDYPDDIREKILSYLEPGKSVAFAVSEAAEMIFARKSDLPKRLIAVGATLATTAAYNRINNFADDNGKRGQKIASALRRHSGERAPDGLSWPDKDDDPQPKDIFVAPVEGDSVVVPAPEPGTGSTPTLASQEPSPKK